jgi:hypothetical protein
MPTLVQKNDKSFAASRTEFVRSYSPTTSWGHAVSMALMFPYLRGLWSFSSIDELNKVYDYSGQGRVLSNGTAFPTFGYKGLMNYGDYVRANSQYMTRADEAGLSITGALTIMAWVYFDALSTGNDTGIISKWYIPVLAQGSYLLHKDAANIFKFSITRDGTTVTTIGDAGVNYSASKWFFVAGTFNPQTSMKLFVNGNWYTLVAAIPASIYDGTEALRFGSYNRGNYLYRHFARLIYPPK